MKDGKIIVGSEDFKLRLKYYIKLQLNRFHEKIINYYKRTSIENYYINISDFEKRKYQVILEGQNSLLLWYDTNINKINYYIYNNILIDGTITYFFKNKSVENNQIFIAQHTLTFEQALNICLIWQNEGYNAGTMSVEYIGVKIGFNLYTLESVKDLNLFKKIKSSSSSNFIIKYNNFFVSLLSI